MNQEHPLVSVIIPTVHRPQLVTRAVQSVLSQTLRAIELIVVVDGPDEATRDALRHIHDARLRVIELPTNGGVSAARNAGVDEARSPWIAFLDDDDEWFPHKLELQLPVAQRSHCRYPIIACRLLARSEAGDLIWPRRYPRPQEAVCDYLFCQSSLLGGEGMISPCALIAPKALLQQVRFTAGLRQYNDVDWLLRAVTLDGVGVEFVPVSEPLLIVHRDEHRPRISHTADWRFSVSWVQANRSLLTPRAYAAFVLTQGSLMAARARAWRAMWRLPWEAFRHGQPSLIDLLAHLVIWLIPPLTRTRLTVFLSRCRRWW